MATCQNSTKSQNRQTAILDSDTITNLYFSCNLTLPLLRQKIRFGINHIKVASLDYLFKIGNNIFITHKHHKYCYNMSVGGIAMITQSIKNNLRFSYTYRTTLFCIWSTLRLSLRTLVIIVYTNVVYQI